MTTLITRTAREGRLLAALVLLAACQGDTLTAPMSPPEPPVVPGTGAVPLLANEPPGFTTLVDNDWKGFTPAVPGVKQALLGWSRYQLGNTGRDVSDLSAPGTPDVLEVLFSGRQGVGPEHLQLRVPTGNSRLYLSVPVWVPAGYVGSSSGVQKLFHVWAPGDASADVVTGRNLVIPAIFGTGTNTLRAQIRVQGLTTTPTQATSFNMGNGAIQRGRWYVYECLLVLNTAGNPDGQAHLWVNGTKVVTRTDIIYSSASRPKYWTLVQLNPTYGGTGTVPAGVKLRYGRAHVSVAR